MILFIVLQKLKVQNLTIFILKHLIFLKNFKLFRTKVFGFFGFMKIQVVTMFQTQFAWASDVPTGTVVLGQSAQITSKSLDNGAFVPNQGKD